MRFCYWGFIFGVMVCSVVYTVPETEFVIVTASYNNKEWCQKNLQSIFEQNYSNWHLIYINDCSQDGTGELVEALINDYGVWDKVTLIHNNERMGHLYNQYHAIHGVDNNKVVVIVDGDDWLATPDVLDYLNWVYTGHDVWVTYGQFWYWKKNHLGCSRQIPKEVLESNTLRDYPVWITSHLRTFYAGLYKMIALEDLLYQGRFYPMAADVATMIPMIEMAGRKHSHFISKVLYIYNDANTLNFYHNHAAEQRAIHAYIRSLPRYSALAKPPFTKSAALKAFAQRFSRYSSFA